MITSQYMLDHCRGELGRGHVERCPRMWLLKARAEARATGQRDMAEACTIALAIQRGTVPNTDEHTKKMRRLTGRKV